MNKNARLIRRLFVYTVAIIAAIVVIGIIRFTFSPMLQEILLANYFCAGRRRPMKKASCAGAICQQKASRSRMRYYFA